MKRRQTFDLVQNAFDVLGNPLRFRIFLRIVQEGCDCDLDRQKGFNCNCVSGIVKELHIPQSTASMYLDDLRRAGLIECKRNGKFVYCKPKKETLVAMKSFLDSTLAI